jgi:trimethylguanosine synthase
LWIETCPETTVEESASKTEQQVDVHLCISRVLLYDQHSSSRVESRVAAAAADLSKTCSNTPSIETVSENVSAAASTVAATRDEDSALVQHEQGLDSGEKKAPVRAIEHTITGGSVTEHQSTPKPVAESGNPKEVSTIKETVDGAPPAASSQEGALAPSSTRNSKDILVSNPRISVQREASARGKVTIEHRLTEYVNLPNGDCGDGIINPNPDTVDDKYWAQRHRLFSRFNEGIQLDAEGWYSVTPEAIANHVAARMTGGSSTGIVLLDAFCGVGGNAIAFGRRDEVSLVICVDTDEARLRMAAHNCHVYKIPRDKIIFVAADAVDVIQSYRQGRKVDTPNPKQSLSPTVDKASSSTEQHAPPSPHGYTFGSLNILPDQIHGIFLSPPWGGSDYTNQKHFDLETIQINPSVNGDGLFSQSVAALPKDDLNLAYFVPRNTNGWRIGQSSWRAGLQMVEMEQNYVNSKLKTITIYAQSRKRLADGKK